MNEVCLVWEQGGSYDTHYEKVILAYATLAEGEAAVEAIRAELKLAWAVQTPYDTMETMPSSWSTDGEFARVQQEYDCTLAQICKVYPIDGGNLPDPDDVQFSAATILLSKMP